MAVLPLLQDEELRCVRGFPYRVPDVEILNTGVENLCSREDFDRIKREDITAKQ